MENLVLRGAPPPHPPPPNATLLAPAQYRPWKTFSRGLFLALQAPSPRLTVSLCLRAARPFG
jgi:hypothetical protein